MGKETEEMVLVKKVDLIEMKKLVVMVREMFDESGLNTKEKITEAIEETEKLRSYLSQIRIENLKVTHKSDDINKIANIIDIRMGDEFRRITKV